MKVLCLTTKIYLKPEDWIGGLNETIEQCLENLKMVYEDGQNEILDLIDAALKVVETFSVEELEA